MKKFIRIDIIGHWRGKDHVSSVNGLADEWEDDNFEKGISCFNLRNVAEGIENLREYWYNIAMFTTPERFKDMQITIFEGEKISHGADFEDIAECEKTIAEIPAAEFMSKVYEAYEKFEDEEINEEEYNEILEGLLC